ncbi:MAG: hypothetical protein WD847_03490 [Pirellulales bacterium]
MAMDPMDPNFPSQAYPPRKQGGSGLLWGLGIGCGLVLLLCCGGGVAFFVYARNMMDIKNDPAEVTAQAKGIVQIDLPDGLKPQSSVSMKIPFVGARMIMVMYQTDDGTGHAMLMEMSGGDAAAEAQMRAQLEAQAQQQGASQMQLTDVESRTIDLQVAGEPATFEIRKGKDSAGVEYIQASGSFKTQAGRGTLLLQVRADQYTEEQIEDSLRSIQ